MKPVNPVCWFEIYVNDLARAQKFYEQTLGITLSGLPNPEGEECMQMLAFPSQMDGANATGSLVKMQGCEPGAGGTIVYFQCEDCAVEESRVVPAGGSIFKPKMSIGEYGFISLCTDTEGNMFGLFSMK